jgi:hypothetical protein
MAKLFCTATVIASFFLQQCYCSNQCGQGKEVATVIVGGTQEQSTQAFLLGNYTYRNRREGKPVYQYFNGSTTFELYYMWAHIEGLPDEERWCVRRATDDWHGNPTMYVLRCLLRNVLSQQACFNTFNATFSSV